MLLLHETTHVAHTHMGLWYESDRPTKLQRVLKFAPQANSLLALCHFSFPAAQPTRSFPLSGGSHLLLVWVEEPRRLPDPPGYSELHQRCDLRVLELGDTLRVKAKRQLTHLPAAVQPAGWAPDPLGAVLPWRKAPGRIVLTYMQTLQDYAHIDLTTHPQWQQHFTVSRCSWSSDAALLLLGTCSNKSSNLTTLLTVHSAADGACLRTVDIFPGSFNSNDFGQSLTGPFCWAPDRPVLAVWGLDLEAQQKPDGGRCSDQFYEVRYPSC